MKILICGVVQAFTSISPAHGSAGVLAVASPKPGSGSPFQSCLAPSSALDRPSLSVVTPGNCPQLPSTLLHFVSCHVSWSPTRSPHAGYSANTRLSEVYVNEGENRSAQGISSSLLRLNFVLHVHFRMFPKNSRSSKTKLQLSDYKFKRFN